MKRELNDALQKLLKVEYASPDWMHYESVNNLLEQCLLAIRSSIENPTINYPLLNDVIWTMEQAKVFLGKENGAPSGDRTGS